MKLLTALFAALGLALTPAAIAQNAGGTEASGSGFAMSTGAMVATGVAAAALIVVVTDDDDEAEEVVDKTNPPPPPPGNGTSTTTSTGG